MEPVNVLVDDAVQPRHQEALTIVLGACFLVIGLCSFAAIILLIQQFQRSTSNSAVHTKVPKRRTTKPTAVTTQYRPLSDTTRRHRGDTADPVSRPSTGAAVPRSGSSSPSAGTSGPNVPSPFTPSAAPPSAARPSAAPRVPVAAAPPSTPSSTAAPASAATSEASGMILTKSRDPVDIALLSRIDQALASGVMRPQEATQLLKSCGCDLEELLRDQLEGDNAAAGTEGLQQPTTSGASSVATSGAAPRVPPAPEPSEPRGPKSSASPALPTALSSGDLDRPNEAAGGAESTTVARTVIDDAMLLKIDRALASGVMRPDQATQLLKSHGYDLDELLREELGEGGGVSRKPSSTLSV